MYNCRYCQDRGCLACDPYRSAWQHEKAKEAAFQAEYAKFMSVYEQTDPSVKGMLFGWTFMKMIVAAIGWGRKMERRRMDDEAPDFELITRTDYLEFNESDKSKQEPILLTSIGDLIDV